MDSDEAWVKLTRPRRSGAVVSGQSVNALILIPYAGNVPLGVARQVDLAALYVNSVQVDLVDVGGDDEAYHRLLHSVWKRAETFVVVEHDVLIHADTLSDLLECKQEWCATPFEYLDGSYCGLGCMKFDARLMERIPDALDAVGNIGKGDATHPPKHWCAQDGRLQAVLSTRGAVLHRHLGNEPLTHLGHDGQPRHRCR